MRLTALLGGAALLCAALAPLAAEAEDATLADISARVENAPVVRAAFEQRRHLTLLKRPIASAGRMTLVDGRGLLWRVERPQAADVLLLRDRMIEWGADGQARRAPVAAFPVFQALAQSLIDAFSGDFQALEANFDARVDATATGWSIALTPKATDLAAVFARMEISGDRHIEAVRIEEASGDRTEIDFSAHQAASPPLEPDEASRFDAAHE